MENCIKVTICGEEYTLMAEESPSYMQKVAALVDTRMNTIMASGRFSRLDAAIPQGNGGDLRQGGDRSGGDLRQALPSGFCDHTVLVCHVTYPLSFKFLLWLCPL